MIFRRFFLTAFFIAALHSTVTASYATDTYLSMVYTNALGTESPFSLFTKGSWTADPTAKYVKLHMYFDEPVRVYGLEVDTCGTTLEMPVTVFFNFDQKVLMLENNPEGDMPFYLETHDGDSKLYMEIGGEPDPEGIETRSLTINFGNNTGLRLCGLRIKDKDDKPYAVKTPMSISGTITASNVLSPKETFDPYFLFDSRFEYGWAADDSPDYTLSFEFAEKRRVEKIRFWNGYQRSANHCFSNGRAKKIIVSGDNGYSETIALKDVMGSELIALKKPFEGKKLTLKIIESYPGKSFKDLSISEIRFFDGRDYFMLDSLQTLKKGIDKNKELFKKADLGQVLGASFNGYENNDEKRSYVYSNIRLRADGSVYLSGSGGNQDETTDEEEVGAELQHFVLGSYEVLESAPKKIKIRISGLYYEVENIYSGDCNGCGRDCNRSAPPEGFTSYKIFQRTFLITPGKEKDSIEIKNLGNDSDIKFKTLLYKIEE